MPIYFRFRSTTEYEYIDLHAVPFIQLSELRAKIIEKKNLQICRLIISDPYTEEILDDDNLWIVNESVVVVSRLPLERFPPIEAGFSIPKWRKEHAGCRVAAVPATPPLQEVEEVDFDDFGDEPFPNLEASGAESESDTDGGNARFGAGMVNYVPRTSSN